MSHLSNGPTGSGVSHFDSAVNESIKTASWGSSARDNKNDGINEGASDDDDFDDVADLTK